jgi:hypothetical protein
MKNVRICPANTYIPKLNIISLFAMKNVRIFPANKIAKLIRLTTLFAKLIKTFGINIQQ